MASVPRNRTPSHVAAKRERLQGGGEAPAGDDQGGEPGEGAPAHHEQDGQAPGPPGRVVPQGARRDVRHRRLPVRGRTVARQQDPGGPRDGGRGHDRFLRTHGRRPAVRCWTDVRALGRIDKRIISRSS